MRTYGSYEMPEVGSTYNSVMNSAPDVQAQTKAPYRAERSFLEEVFDLLQIGQYTVMGAATEGEKMKHNPLLKPLAMAGGATKGFMQGLSILPGWEGFKEPADYSTSDWLSASGWNPTSTVGKVTKGAVSFVGDVAFDPLTYVGGGAVKSVLRGSASRFGKEALEKGAKELAEVGATRAAKEFAESAATGGLKPLSKDSAMDIMINFSKKNNVSLSAEELAKGADDYVRLFNEIIGQSRVGAGSLEVGGKFAPFGNKIFGESADKTLTMISKEQLQKFGDKTIAPHVDKLIESFYSSPLGSKFSTKTGFRKLAQKNPEMLYETVEMLKRTNRLGVNQQEFQKVMSDWVKKYDLTDMTPAMQRRAIKVFQGKEMIKYVNTHTGKIFGEKSDAIDDFIKTSVKSDKETKETVINAVKDKVKVKEDIAKKMKQQYDYVSNAFIKADFDYSNMSEVDGGIFQDYVSKVSKVDIGFDKLYDSEIDELVEAFAKNGDEGVIDVVQKLDSEAKFNMRDSIGTSTEAKRLEQSLRADIKKGMSPISYGGEALDSVQKGPTQLKFNVDGKNKSTPTPSAEDAKAIKADVDGAVNIKFGNKLVDYANKLIPNRLDINQLDRADLEKLHDAFVDGGEKGVLDLIRNPSNTSKKGGLFKSIEEQEAFLEWKRESIDATSVDKETATAINDYVNNVQQGALDLKYVYPEDRQILFEAFEANGVQGVMDTINATRDTKLYYSGFVRHSNVAGAQAIGVPYVADVYAVGIDKLRKLMDAKGDVNKLVDSKSIEVSLEDFAQKFKDGENYLDEFIATGTEKKVLNLDATLDETEGVVKDLVTTRAEKLPTREEFDTLYKSVSDMFGKQEVGRYMSDVNEKLAKRKGAIRTFREAYTSRWLRETSPEGRAKIFDDIYKDNANRLTSTKQAKQIEEIEKIRNNSIGVERALNENLKTDYKLDVKGKPMSEPYSNLRKIEKEMKDIKFDHTGKEKVLSAKKKERLAELEIMQKRQIENINVQGIDPTVELDRVKKKITELRYTPDEAKTLNSYKKVVKDINSEITVLKNTDPDFKKIADDYSKGLDVEIPPKIIELETAKKNLQRYQSKVDADFVKRATPKQKEQLKELGDLSKKYSDDIKNAVPNKKEDFVRGSGYKLASPKALEYIKRKNKGLKKAFGDGWMPTKYLESVSASQSAKQAYEFTEIVKLVDRNIGKIKARGKAIASKSALEDFYSKEIDKLIKDFKYEKDLLNKGITDPITNKKVLSIEEQVKKVLDDMYIQDDLIAEKTVKNLDKRDIAIDAGDLDSAGKINDDILTDEITDVVRSTPGVKPVIEGFSDEQARGIELMRESFMKMGIKEMDAGVLKPAQLTETLGRYFPSYMTKRGKLNMAKIKKAKFIDDAVKDGMSPKDAKKAYEASLERAGTWVTDAFGFKASSKPDFAKRASIDDILAFNDYAGYEAFTEDVAGAYIARSMAHNDYFYQNEMSERIVKDLGFDAFDWSKGKDGVMLPLEDGFEYATSYGNIIDSTKRRIDGKVMEHFKDVKASSKEEYYRIYSEIAEAERNSIGAELGIDLINLGDWAKPVVKLSPEQARSAARLFGQEHAPRQMFNTQINIFNHARDVEIARKSNQLLNTYDKFLHLYKLQITAVIPGFHGRNIVSNQFQNFLAIGADITDPKLQLGATKTLKAGGDSKEILFDDVTWGRLFDEASMEGILDTGYFKVDFGEGSVFGKTDATFKEKAKTGADTIKQTIKESSYHPLDTDAIYYRAGQEAGTFLESRDKLLHFASLRRQGKTAQEAAESVNKFLFDYNDLTIFEHTTMKRIFPFYTWIKKNIGLQTSELINQPDTYRNLAKLITSIDGGVPPEEQNDRLPIYATDWQQTPFEIGGKDVFISPNLPHRDLDSLPANMNPVDFIKQVISMSSPAIKIPIELGTNTNMFYGSKIAGGDDKGLDRVKYISSYIESLGFIRKMASDRKSPEDKRLDLLNRNTGLRLGRFGPDADEVENANQ